MKLRDYQERAVNSVFKNIKEGKRLLTLILPTGAGKTVVFSHIAKKAIEGGKKVLVLAHREELLNQAKEKLHMVIPNINIGIEQGNQVADNSYDIIVASVATIGREGSERIKKFDKSKFGLIIIDECFTGNTLILSSDGTTKTIKEIVDNRLELEVYNENNLRLEKNKIYDWFKVKGIRDGIKLKFGVFFSPIKCTTNHKFDIIRNGEKNILEAKDILIGDYLLFNINKDNRFRIAPILTNFQKEVLIGTLLGDGHFSDRGGLDRFSFSTCLKHVEYFNYRLNIFRNIGKSTKGCYSGYNGKSILRFGSLTGYEFKSISNDIDNIRDISWVSIAFWYMDDGSISSDVARFNTQGWSHEMNIKFINILEKKGLRCRINIENKKDGRKFNYISLYRDSTKVLYENIKQYIPNVMQYKLSESYRGYFKEYIEEVNDFCLVKIIKKDNIKIKDVYNISVENSHKYIANGINTYNCHHITASTYIRVLEYFGCYKGSEKGLLSGHPVLLGVTATPNRADNVGLDKVFDTISFKYEMQTAIKEGYLSPIRAFTVFTDTDLNGVHTSMGDFQINELADAVNNTERNLQIIETFKSKCQNELTIVFAVNVQHAKDLCSLFITKGVKANYITGALKKEERQKILLDFHNEKITVLINVGVLIEGFDEPNIRNVLLIRPTCSAGLMCQMVGRGTRLAEGKEYCRIFDFVDNLKKNKIVTSSSLIGLSQPIKAENTDIFAIKDKLEELLNNKPGENLRELDLDKIEERILEVDIFAAAELDTFVKDNSKFSRTTFLGGFKISLGEDEQGDRFSVEIRENLIGKYTIEFIVAKKQDPTAKNQYKKYENKVVATFDAKDKKEALSLSDAVINKNYSNRVNLVHQKAGWRADIATDKQIQILKKNGFPNANQLTKGQATILIGKIFNDKQK